MCPGRKLLGPRQSSPYSQIVQANSFCFRGVILLPNSSAVNRFLRCVATVEGKKKQMKQARNELLQTFAGGLLRQCSWRERAVWADGEAGAKAKYAPE